MQLVSHRTPCLTYPQSQTQSPSSTTSYCLHLLRLHHSQYPPVTLNRAQRPMEKGENGKKKLRTRSKVVCLKPVPVRSPLSQHSLQDALITFFQPIKNGNARLDFYTMYKKEVTKYDTDYIKKYDDDLNTTLIFVHHLSLAFTMYLICSCRWVCSLPPVQLSSLTSTQNLNPT